MLYGPIPGSRHDSFMLRESNLLPKLEECIPITRNNRIPLYQLYGDPAYPQSAYLFGGFRYARAGAEAEWNTQMSKVRESVEWLYGEIVSLWSFLDMKRKMKLLLSPIHKYYVIGVFFTNIRCLTYGNECADYFDCKDQLSFEQYINLVPLAIP
jgi:hypothetical protein